MSRLRKTTSKRVATLANYHEAFQYMEAFGDEFSTEKHKVECHLWEGINGVIGDNGIGYIINGEWDEDLYQLHWKIKYFTFGLRFLKVHSFGYDEVNNLFWVLYKIKSMQMFRNDFKHYKQESVEV